MSRVPAAGKRILCVGNDEQLLRVRQLLLEREGYWVEVLRGERLVAFKPGFPLALVILCHTVDEANCVEWVAWVQHNMPQTSILLLDGTHAGEARFNLPHSSTRPQDLLKAVHILVAQSPPEQPV